MSERKRVNTMLRPLAPGAPEAVEWMETAVSEIRDLREEVGRLRKAEGHMNGCALRGKLLAGIAPMCTPCTCDRVYQKRLNRLLERLEQITAMGMYENFGEFSQGNANGWNQCRIQVQAAIAEAQEDDDAD